MMGSSKIRSIRDMRPFVLLFAVGTCLLGQNTTTFQATTGSQMQTIVVNHKGPTDNSDVDGNGLPDAWERQYFGHIGVDPNADPDGDGLTNLQEFRLGSDPISAAVVSHALFIPNAEVLFIGGDVPAPYPTYADAVTAFTNQVATGCMAYWTSWPGNLFSTFNSSFAAGALRINAVPSGGTYIWIASSINLKSESSLSIGYSISGSDYGNAITAVLYNSLGEWVDTMSGSGFPVGALTHAGIPSDGEYFVVLATQGAVGDFLITSSDPMTVNPVIALWDDNGVIRQLRRCGNLPQLAVDANRDGVIMPSSEDSSDATSSSNPYRFWINDDDDHGNFPGDVGEEHMPAVRPDYSSNLISSQRDLEDYARLWISTQGLNAAFVNGDMYLGLKWSNVSSGAPAIKVFASVETDGGTAYLKDSSSGGIAQQQAAKYALIDERNAGEDAGSSTHTTVGGTDVFVLPKSLFANLSEAQPKIFLLFEGCSVGKGQLKVVILDKNKQVIGEGPGVWMDLCNVKTMYERATVSPDAPYHPYLFSDQPGSDTYLSFTIDTDNAFMKQSDEEAKALVFVHGWNMSYGEYLSFSETMFKRLWWQGYKGRFCAFRWGTLTLTDLDSYNTSEFWAWRYGDALRDYIENPASDPALGLKVRLPGYSVSIVAHSMGNIVAGSALRRGATVHRYFLMEAAVPSGCYNDSVNNFQSFLDAEVAHPTSDVVSDLGYRLYLQSASGNVGKMVNFYNELDFALATGGYVFHWLQTNWVNQQINNKPDNPGSVFVPGQYHYDPYQPIGQRCNLTYITGSRSVLNIFESLSYVARPRSRALGAEPNSSSVISTSVDLQGFDFARDRDDHSGQFTRQIQQLSGFYKTINDELK
jgi:pimeloyl-ACP methyl ester carboxylesterase